MAQAFTILRSDCKSSSAAPVESVSSQLPCDLISFLAIAQALGVDVLALTWHPALDRVGRGGTSNIQELLVKSLSSFAFKRLEYSDHANRDEKTIFRAFIAEISELGHKALRAHPNIQPVLGICWDMRADGRVWPVLVSKKSNFGNLEEYMDSVEGQSLSFASRLEICAGVASAIRDMHSCHIVHGDVKPSNVLIDKDDSARNVPKVIDFGYATLFAGRGLVDMPFTPGWSAPATNGGESFDRAKTMDAFSFGLLCFWMLFHSSPRPKRFDFAAAAPRILITTSHKLVEAEGALKATRKKEFEALFSLTLSCDAEERTGDFNEILKILRPSRTQNSPRMQDVAPEERPMQSELSFIRLAGQLYLSDIRVRTHITQVFEEVVETSTDTDRQRQCAFEAAICYTLGFGTPRDVTKSHLFLARSGRTELELTKELKLLHDTSTVYQNGIVVAYQAEGTIFSPYISLLSQPRDIVNRIMQDCKKELQDVEPYLGIRDPLFQSLKRDYALLMVHQQLYEEAETVWLEIISTSKDTLGLNNSTTITDMGNLANVLTKQSKCDRAEKILTEAIRLSAMAPELGPQHQITLSRKNQLAFLKGQKGEYASSAELHQEVLEINKRVLGDRHPEVLENRIGLLAALDGLGKTENIVKELEEVLDFNMRVWGPEFSETIKTRFELANALLVSGANERAEQETQTVLEIGSKYLDSDDVLLSCRNVRAQVLLRLGKGEEAEALAEETLKLSGISAVQTGEIPIISLDGLAQILAARGKVAAAEVHQREAVRRIMASEMADSFNAYMFKHNLAVTLERLEKYEEAGKLYREAYDGRLRNWGPTYPDTLESERCLSRVLELQGERM